MTPRRILLLVGGLIAFVAVYLVYARFFGWLDGLPQLPAQMLCESDGTCRPPLRLTSPTIELLKIAFGDTSPETEPAHYPTQLRFLQGESLMVLAAGSPPSNPNSNRITLSPFSLAVFGKPRPEHLRRPGEVTEVSTVHADKAVLEFDRVIHSVAEIGGAKLVRLELVSDPEQAPPDPARREGKVHVTSNQRSADPGRRLLLRTVGPVFYRDQDCPPGGPPPTGPDIWTDAAVEIVDRGNLPRAPRSAGVPTPAAAPVRATDVRTPAAVGAILTGRSLPPPTVTAVGMRVYLEHAGPTKPAPRKEPRPIAGGVRRVTFLEKVVMNLWVEGGQGLVGSAAPPASGAVAAVTGGLVPAARAAAGLSRDLLQVETRGPFVYDADKNLARFDVLPLADPQLPNDVQVTKISPRAAAQTLFSQVLEIEFDAPGNDAAAGSAAAAGARYKRVHAWTYTPGRFLTVGSDADQLEAYGQDLDHDPGSGRTRLTGGPLYAVQKRNVLTAGAPKTPAVLLIEPSPGPAGPGTGKQATVLGPGRVELYDPATRAVSVAASWQTSMVQTRETTDGHELDLYTLSDGAKFEDLKSDFWLKGKVLKLWLGSVPPAGVGDAPPASAPVTRSRPHRLQAVGEVSGHSADLDIEQSEHLNTLFRDTTPVANQDPEPPAPQDPPVPRPGSPAPAPKPPADRVSPPPVEGPSPKSPDPRKKPMKLRARTIDTWVVREPVSKPAPTGRPGGDAVKYRLEKARCEGMVSAHQEPADPTKPRGTDILGSLLLIENEADGGVLTVRGWEDRPGEVHNEGTSLIGPFVVIDQLHNRAEVRGRGSVVMHSATDLSGNTLKQPEPVVVHFRDGMTFHGAKKVADFFGKVNATQGGSWVTCHTMQVNFDRPVYFTRENRPDRPNGAPEPKPRIDVVSCYPAPADTAEGPLELQVVFTQVDRDPATGKPVGRQQVVAREFQVRAQARDPNGGEPYKHLQAAGPGEVRIWEPGTRDDDGTGPRPARRPGDPDRQTQTEMKLTYIKFTGRMNGREKGPTYRDVTFLDPVEVVHAPTDDPDLVIEPHRLPPRSVQLTCSEKLIVWTHKQGTGPAEQHMEATGNAYLRNVEYDGWGDTIRNDGKKVTFLGMGSVPARIKSRAGGNDQTGKKITYDRATNRYEVEGSIGGTLVSPPKK